MAQCKQCGKEKNFFEGGNGLCGSCYASSLRRKTPEESLAEAKATEVESEKLREAAKHIVVTTEAFVGDVYRLGVIATEVVLGMNIFRDFLSNVRDVFGGRSGSVQNTLEEARVIALQDLRAKAAELGADAIVALDIDYHSISTGSAVNMMMVSVSGTAVKWKADLGKSEALQNR